MDIINYLNANPTGSSPPRHFVNTVIVFAFAISIGFLANLCGKAPYVTGELVSRSALVVRFDTPR
jgi:hypothetical protein